MQKDSATIQPAGKADEPTTLSVTMITQLSNETATTAVSQETGLCSFGTANTSPPNPHTTRPSPNSRPLYTQAPPSESGPAVPLKLEAQASASKPHALPTALNAYAAEFVPGASSFLTVYTMTEDAVEDTPHASSSSSGCNLTMSSRPQRVLRLQPML